MRGSFRGRGVFGLVLCVVVGVVICDMKVTSACFCCVGVACPDNCVLLRAAAVCLGVCGPASQVMEPCSLTLSSGNTFKFRKGDSVGKTIL